MKKERKKEKEKKRRYLESKRMRLWRTKGLAWIAIHSDDWFARSYQIMKHQESIDIGTFCVFLSRIPCLASIYPAEHSKNTSRIDCGEEWGVSKTQSDIKRKKIYIYSHWRRRGGGTGRESLFGCPSGGLRGRKEVLQFYGADIGWCHDHAMLT